MQNQNNPPLTTPGNNTPASSELQPTLLDHIHEVRRRLFWVVGFVILASAAAFPFQQQLLGILTEPLGDERLYYLTPVGGFAFIIKLSTYVGIILAIPLLMYHLYRFLEPLMQTIKRSVIFYASLSTLLATIGTLFAYFISLPAALGFLTNFNIGEIQAMLTVDAYLSFVMTYLLGAALLFQIPLILLIINSITRLPPKNLMGFQRYVIVAAFIIAAVISPTPDIMNQAFLAAPIIVMYQIGICMVWLSQRRSSRRPAPVVVADSEIPQEILESLLAPTPIAQPVAAARPTQHPVAITALPKPPVQPPIKRVAMDGFKPVPRRLLAQPVRTNLSRRLPTPAPRHLAVPQRPRTIDGITRQAAAV